MSDLGVTFIDPYYLASEGEGGAFPLGIAARCLAQGDSWFSIGAFPPGATSNILNSLALSKSVAVVNCARPGKELQLMTDTMQDPMFMRLLSDKKLAVEFDAIFLSGGGNDLIAAVGVLPAHASGPQEQLFLDPATRGGIKVATDHYLSDQGWDVFAAHISYCLDQLVTARDRSVNQRKPLFLHTYAYCMPRPAGAGFGFGPWLSKAMDAYQIPNEDRLALAKRLMDKLEALLQEFVAANFVRDPQCNIYLIDTKTNAELILANGGGDGDSGDWINEIHPNYSGYDKLAQCWRWCIEPILFH